MLSQWPKISVITVTKDDFSGLVRTRDSVVSQKYGGVVEHIVVNNKESDVSALYLADEGLKDPHLTAISGKDSGIYNAMNIGLRAASGDIYWWLNSGDTFSDPTALTRIFSHIDRDFVGWGYGVTAIYNSQNLIINFAGAAEYNYIDHTLGESFIPHPSSFFSNFVVSQIGEYDETVGIVADQLFMMKANLKCRPQFIDEYVANFQHGGVSSQLTPRELRRQLDVGCKRHKLLSFANYWRRIPKRGVLLVKDLARELVTS